MSRTPGGLTAGRGRVVLGLGELRACEGVRGRPRACEGVFYPYPYFVHNEIQKSCKFEFLYVMLKQFL